MYICIHVHVNVYLQFLLTLLPSFSQQGKENDKTVDEAYICLKLAYLMKYEPPNIVEYFGAAMLPQPNHNKIQLFLELMPCKYVSLCFSSLLPYIHPIGSLFNLHM